MKLPTWLRPKTTLPKRTPKADLPNVTPQQLADELDSIDKMLDTARFHLKKSADLYWEDGSMDELRAVASTINVLTSKFISNTHGLQRRERALRGTLGDILDLPEAGEQ